MITGLAIGFIAGVVAMCMFRTSGYRDHDEQFELRNSARRAEKDVEVML